MTVFDGCFLEGAIHTLDLTIDPEVIWLSQAMQGGSGQGGNAILQCVKAVERMFAEWLRKRLLALGSELLNATLSDPSWHRA